MIFGIADDLEPVAGRLSVAEFEGIESDPRPEQIGAKVEFVDFARAISEPHRFELACSNPSSPIASAISALRHWRQISLYPCSIDP